MNRTPLVRLSALLAILFLLLPGNLQAQEPVPGVPTQPIEPAGPPSPPTVTAPDSFPLEGGVPDSGPDWPGEDMDASRSFEGMTDRSLALDTDGHPHVAYGGSHLFYAEFDGSEWLYSIVDSGDETGAYASLALDSAGRPHISYNGLGTVKYAYFDGSAWQTGEVVPASSRQCHSTSLALDASDQPRISYYCYDPTVNSGHLHYAEWDGSAWVLSQVQVGFPDQMGGLYASLALDSAGRPHIAYYVYEAVPMNGELRYAYREGQTWLIETVQRGSPYYPVGSYPSLALDSSDQPHVIYTDARWRDLYYAHISGTVWITETVETGGGIENNIYSSLVLDQAGQPHIGYYNASLAIIHYAYKSGASWTVETVDEINFSLASGLVSLARSTDGQPHLTYYDARVGHFKYATYAVDTWQVEVLDRAGNFGLASAMALDTDGRPHLSFCRIAGDDCAELFYATPRGNAWQMETVDICLGRDIGRPSLLLDAADQPHLAYHVNDPVNSRVGLYYAHLSGTVWITETVDAGDASRNTGQYPSLALQPNGQPCISYYNYDPTNQDAGLRYACSDGAAWTIQRVESSGAAGLYNSLALDNSGQAHVGYYYSDTQDLRYAFYDGVSWVTETVDAVGDVGQGASLQLDSAGQPHISYRDADGQSIKYAYKSGTTWHMETVDGSRTERGFTSLLLDGADRPHIVYAEGVRLRYTYYDGASWPSEIVAGSVSPAGTLSLGMDPTGRVHVTYLGSDYGVHYAYRLDRGGGDEWTIETAVMARQASEASTRSMAVDAAGYPHIAYGGNRLYYLSYDGTAWQREIADASPNSGYGVSLVLDSAGRPHIGYYDKRAGMIKYAYYDGSAWQINEVYQVSPHADRGCTSIALDSAGRPHIAHPAGWSTYSAELAHSYWDGATWQTETITTSVPAYVCPSLALDSQDYPHVTYGDPYYSALHYASYDGTAWAIELVTRTTYYYSAHPALALDSQDRPRIAFSDQGGNAVMYASYDGSAWQIETVAATSFSNMLWPSLVVDSADRPHLVYPDGIYGALVYAYQDGPTSGPEMAWITETVNAVAAIRLNVALALAPSGEPVVSSWDPDDYAIRLATRESSSWRLQVADTLDLPDSYPSLAMDVAGKPHLSYFQQRGLMYARRESTGWQYQPVATDPELGVANAHSSIKVDGDGHPHIAYSAYLQDGESGIVGYSVLSGTTWLSTTIEQIPLRGSWPPSLALDSAGQPHVAYYRSIYPTSSQLIYASLSGTLWLTETVVDSPNVYRTGHPALAMDSSGHPHISYLGFDAALMYAAYDGSAWHIETVDGQSGRDGGWCNSLVLDALDRPHIGYCLTDGQLLKYAYWDGQWHTEVIETAFSRQQTASLAVDAAGNPHMAYYHAGYGVLKHAYRDGQRWHAQQIETEYYTGKFPSLALDVAGRPHIVYYDGLYGDLKHAYQERGSCGPLETAQIIGPAILRPDENALYLVTYVPLTATLPVTLTWDNGALGLTAAYSWTQPGAYTIAVIAANACSVVSTTYTVAVCQEIEAVAIAGPAFLSPGETGLFTATVAPPTATLPLTFAWSNGALGPTAAYSWTLPGSYTVAVTATNSCGQATGEWDVEVGETMYRVYLPLVLKGGQP